MSRDAQKFKIGFLKKIAELGLLPSDFERAMAKSSTSLVKDIVGAISATVPRLATLGLGIPLVGGALVGGVTRSAMQADDETLDEVKNQEMTMLYRQLARDVRERTKREQARRTR